MEAPIVLVKKKWPRSEVALVYVRHVELYTQVFEIGTGRSPLEPRIPEEEVKRLKDEGFQVVTGA